MARKPTPASKAIIECKAIPVPPAADPAASITLPAIFTNHGHVSWEGGLIRLTMSEERGGQLAQRAAMLITAGHAAALINMLQQAVDALTPAPVAEVIEATDEA